MVEGIAWLIHASRHLARLFAPHLAGPIEEMELRAKYGIRRELLPLIRLRGIGRVRARRLFNNAMGSVEALRAAGPEKVGRVIGEKIAAQVLSNSRECGTRSRGRSLMSRYPSPDSDERRNDRTSMRYLPGGL